MPLPIILGVAAAAAIAGVAAVALSDDNSSSSSSSDDDREEDLEKERKRIEREAKEELRRHKAREKKRDIDAQVARRIDTSEDILKDLIDSYVDIDRSWYVYDSSKADNVGVAKRRISNILSPRYPRYKEIDKMLVSIWDIKNDDMVNAIFQFESLYCVKIEPKKAVLDKKRKIKKAEKELQRLNETIEQLAAQIH